MLIFKDISKTYYSSNQAINALENISFSLNRGEMVSVVGKSGAGKTTLVKLITGQEKPSCGSIFFEDIDLVKLKPSALQKIRRKIGVIYQDYKLLETRTVKENLSYLMQALGVSEKSIQRDIPYILKLVGLEERQNNFPCQLSGGEKQRLAIARGLIHRPQLIIADEPTGNLDFDNTCQIIEILKKVHTQPQYSPAIILCTHDQYLVDSLAGRVITLKRGKIIS